MKKTILASIAMAMLALSASAQPVSIFDGITLDDSPRPETWKFHFQYRDCDPNTWAAPVNSNVWTNWTCQTLTNSSTEDRRERRRARAAAAEAEAATPPATQDGD